MGFSSTDNPVGAVFTIVVRRMAEQETHKPAKLRVAVLLSRNEIQFMGEMEDER